MINKRILRGGLLEIVLAFGLAASARAFPEAVRSAVVKLYVTSQHADYTMPWQSGAPSSGTGTGFIVAKKRILTNAHVVSDTRLIQVQKDGSARLYDADVRFIGHDCDLAVLEVRDDSFFEDTRALKFARDIPDLTDEVIVLGYPLGGTRLSITKGVVSRIDYSNYSHSEVDQHLVMQVDAAINPGNSGGPVLFDGRVVGLAFQGLARADNIGYAIPLPVIQRFLTDIEDGAYDAYPELGVAFMQLHNPALRRDLKMQDDQTGVVLHYIDPFGSAFGLLRSGDVLLTADGYPIDNDGTIRLAGKTVLFGELLERKQVGESMSFRVLRGGRIEYVETPLTPIKDPFIFRRIYDENPRYFVTAGLVFAPLNREFLAAARLNATEPPAHQLFYYTQYAKIDGLYAGREEFVVLIRRLPHPVNTYADKFIFGIVSSVNGKPVSRLEDLDPAFQSDEEGFHVIAFEGMQENLVLDARDALRSNPAIFNRYGIESRSYYGEKP